MKKGDSVKIKKGFLLPDYEDLIFDNWQGRITEIDGDNITIELDSITLDAMNEDYIIDSIENELDYCSFCLEIGDVELTEPRDTQNDVLLKQKKIAAIYPEDEEERRIFNILKSEDIHVDEDNQKTYFKYLKNNIQKPCIMTGAEDFDWEEPYLLGGWSKKEYEELKLVRPSYTDRFELMKFVDVDDFRGIIVRVKRLSDNKKFDLPLWDLKSVNRESPNYLLISDYSSWMTNYR